MSDQEQLQQRMFKGSQAQSILENETIVAAFDYMERRYLDEWKATQFRDTQQRECLWNAVNNLQKIKEHLRLVVANGKIAQRELDALYQNKRAS